MILCYKENVYKKASELLHLSNNKNVKMLDDSIDEFSRITDFLDSKEKIESIKKVILKIKNQQKLDEQQRLEEKYQRGLLVPQEKISISMLKNKINILLENKDYKDSSKLIDLYKKHLLLLETDKKKLISELGVSITSNISIKQVNEILSTKMPQSQKEALSKILLEETNIIDEFNKRINNNTLELMYRNEELKNGRASNNSKA